MRKYSFVTVVAATVGVLLMAGGALAAGRFIITNIHQIKPSVRAQLKGNRGPQGARGPAGIAGVTRVESAFVTVSPNGVNGTFAECPAGDVVLGGGWDGGSNPDPDMTVAYNDPSTDNAAWLVTVGDHSGLSTTLAAVAECAPAAAGAAHDVRPKALARAQVAAEVAALKAHH